MFLFSLLASLAKRDIITWYPQFTKGKPLFHTSVLAADSILQHLQLLTWDESVHFTFLPECCSLDWGHISEVVWNVSKISSEHDIFYFMQRWCGENIKITDPLVGLQNWIQNITRKYSLYSLPLMKTVQTKLEDFMNWLVLSAEHFCKFTLRWESGCVR